MKNENYKLKNRIAYLESKIENDQNISVQELQMQNKSLGEQVRELENLLQYDSGSNEAYKDLYASHRELQNKFIKLSEENIELKFESEQAKKDNPRLKGRVEDLQRYCDALKKENQELSGGGNSARSSIHSGSSNVRRIGESGRSVHDLEKTVGLLKKVIEKLQRENDQLKKAPGVISNEEFKKLLKENESLKIELDDIRKKVGGELSERYTSQQKGTAKIMADHDKLRKDYIKEMEANEKLRVKVKSLEMQIDKVSKRNTEKVGGLHSIDIPQSRSSTHIYEDRQRALEDLDRKNKQIADQKEQLRSFASEERDLRAEITSLKKQLKSLLDHPNTSKLNSHGLKSDLHECRLTIEKLNNEKDLLIRELSLLQPHTSSDHYGGDILSKARMYDDLLKENLDLRIEIKTFIQEKDKLQNEISKLKNELQSFGPEFFEEIEDLKYNYKESVSRNVVLEEKLRRVSSQFGIDFNVDSPT